MTEEAPHLLTEEAPHLLTEEEGGILIATLNRPDKLNAYRNETADQLRDAVLRAGRDPSAHSILMTGEGRAFGAGYDLATVKPEPRAALQALRETILEVAPDAVECVSYGMPAFRVKGRVVCYFAAAKGWCAFYPGGHAADWAAELPGFSISKGTIRFQPGAPIPDDVLRRIIARCVERNSVRAKGPAAP